jgi:hypothetical protein
MQCEAFFIVGNISLQARPPADRLPVFALAQSRTPAALPAGLSWRVNLFSPFASYGRSNIETRKTNILGLLEKLKSTSKIYPLSANL